MPNSSDFDLLHRDFLALREGLDEYKKTTQENQDAFFKCSMAVVIFCKFFGLVKKLIFMIFN